MTNDAPVQPHTYAHASRCRCDLGVLHRRRPMVHRRLVALTISGGGGGASERVCACAPVELTKGVPYAPASCAPKQVRAVVY